MSHPVDVYVSTHAGLSRMLMTQLWWVQDGVTTKRRRAINDSLQRNTERIKSHQPSGILARKTVYSCAAMLSRTKECSTDRIDHICNALCSTVLELNVSFVFGGSQHPAIDVTWLDIKKCFVLTEEAKMRKIGKHQHVTPLYFFTLKPWPQGSLYLAVKPIQIHFISAHFHSQ